MLTESVLLAFIGGLVGLAVAYAAQTIIVSLAFPDAPHVPIATSPSLPVFVFAFLLSLVTGVVFGIVPAWITSHSDPAEALRGVNRSTRDRSSLPQKSLIVVQAALSLLLLVGAGLLTKSLNNLEHQNFGIQTANRYVVAYRPRRCRIHTGESCRRFTRRSSRGSARCREYRASGWRCTARWKATTGAKAFASRDVPSPGRMSTLVLSWDRVSPEFFETVGQPVIRGRGFTDADTATSQLVAVVNQAFVKKFFPKEDPIGRHFGVFEHKYAGAFEIVGVVADAKYSDPRGEIRPMYFRPLNQHLNVTEPDEIMAEGSSLYINSITLLLQASAGERGCRGAPHAG